MNYALICSVGKSYTSISLAQISAKSYVVFGQGMLICVKILIYTSL